MAPRQTAVSYDKLARHWADDAFLTKNGIAQHERAIQFSRGSGLAIDIGCGSNGRIIDLLLARGFEVEGLDISSRMLALAKEKHPSVLFHHARGMRTGSAFVVCVSLTLFNRPRPDIYVAPPIPATTNHKS